MDDINPGNEIERVPLRFHDFLNFVSDGQREIFIFGADIAGKAVAQLLADQGMNISGFLDNNRNKCFVELDGVYSDYCNPILNY